MESVKSVESIMDLAHKLVHMIWPINWKLVPIKMVYFFFAMALFGLYPFLILQAKQIGLSYGDISIVLGIIPVAAGICNPPIGFLGDKIGYKPVLLIAMVMIGLFGTCFDLTPRYKEYTRLPMATVRMKGHDNTSFVLMSVMWPITYPECNIRKSNNVTLCDGSSPLVNQTFFDDIIKYMRCENDGNAYEIKSLDTNDFKSTLTNSLETYDAPGNGTFCDLVSTKSNTTLDISCEIDINNNPYLGECYNTEGSHNKTFFVYLLFRILWQVFMSAAFVFLDGSSMYLAHQQNSSYALIFVWQIIAGIFAPLISGALVQDSDDPNVETYYQYAFYFSDGMLAMAAIVVLFFVEVRIEKNKEKFIPAVKKILNPALGVFLLLIFSLGIPVGISANYVYAYLQDELQASSSMIGIGGSITSLSGLLVSPFARKFISWTGEINMVFLSIIITSSRLFLIAAIRWVPPYHYYIYSALACMEYVLPWIASMQYGFKIAPPNLIATVISLIGSSEYIIGQGVGGFVGGQLVDNNLLTLPQLFYASAGFSLCWSLICFVVYKAFCKKYENKLIDAKQKEEKRIATENARRDTITTISSGIELRQRSPSVNNEFEQTRL